MANTENEYSSGAPLNETTEDKILQMAQEGFTEFQIHRILNVDLTEVQRTVIEDEMAQEYYDDDSYDDSYA